MKEEKKLAEEKHEWLPKPGEKFGEDLGVILNVIACSSLLFLLQLNPLSDLKKGRKKRPREDDNDDDNAQEVILIASPTNDDASDNDDVPSGGDPSAEKMGMRY